MRVLVDSLYDDPRTQEPCWAVGRQLAGGIKHSVEVLAEVGLVQSATVDIRFFQASVLFKLYIINGV
ncbi:hypothetical protein [Streptomyces millisiae]|uniref:Uncharacterized protein n=1 Tax=Streptomyces millisiae TaxID=3075542 RepID=A0ABU2LJV3_9ACTN|nr:hypothetical protein [Streptomyces sp. DSM 44918]MDT0317872.1 hypothetical protein [Streptomyces sp. DSM 44918]